MPGKIIETAGFSLQDTVIDSLKQEFPIPGQHNLKKVGNKKIMVAAKTDADLLVSDSFEIIRVQEKTIKEEFSKGYKNRIEYEEAFNNHPFNRIFKFRNLMSGKQDINFRTLLKNAGRDMSGMHEENAPSIQKWLNYGATALIIPRALRFVWSLYKKVINLALDIVKLPTVVVPSILYKLSFQGIMAAVGRIEEVQTHIAKTDRNAGNMFKTLLDLNLSKLGKHIIDRAKIAGFTTLLVAAAIAFGLTRLWHFIGKSTLAPRENFRQYWNDKDEDGKATISGKILAVLSIVTTIAVYTAAAFFLAPFAVKGLSALSSVTAGTSFAPFVSSLLTGISKLSIMLNAVTAPLGIALTTALESIATFLPFLAPAAVAAGNIAPTTLGLLTLTGTAIAVLGTGESIVQGALISDKYHGYALKKVIKDDTAGSTVAMWNKLKIEKAPLLADEVKEKVVVRSRPTSHSSKDATVVALDAALAAKAAHTAEEDAKVVPLEVEVKPKTPRI